jgi:hypothetical protein
MSRRDEIAKEIADEWFREVTPSDLAVADKIIALDKPTGVVRVDKDGKETELTPDECVEVLKQIIICGRYVLVVSDFSRLRVKE